MVRQAAEKFKVLFPWFIQERTTDKHPWQALPWLLAFLFLQDPLPAQRLPVPDALTVNDGLCFRHVNFITQDHQGLMWFGTTNGLSRYDGYRFVNFGKEATAYEYFPTNGFQRNGALFLNDSVLWTIADFQLFATNINSFETNPIPDIEGRLLYLLHGNDKDIWLISDNDQEQFL